MDISNMLKQAQEMQANLKKSQDLIAIKEFTYERNGVSVTAKGDATISSISINPDLLKSDDKELLEDLIQVAVNGALGDAQKAMQDEIGGLTGGMDIPGLF